MTSIITDIKEAERIFKNWAKADPYITKVYLFGSRLTGKSKKTGLPVKLDSDIDIAVEFECEQKDDDQLVFWISKSKDWHAELKILLGLTRDADLDLQWFHPVHTPHMSKYLKYSSKVVYICLETLFDKLLNEIILIYHHLDMFKSLGEIIDKNKKIEKMDKTLLVWMKTAFATDLVIGIGRICDKDKRANSLVQFLTHLKANPEYLSRERYVNFYKEKHHLLEEVGNADFDRLAGKGQPVYDSELLDTDIEKLTQTEPFLKIIGYRDQYVAHSDSIKDTPPPTYNELFTAFEAIKEIVFKYCSLISCTAQADLVPIIQGDWAKVLTVPWIDNSGRDS